MCPCRKQEFLSLQGSTFLKQTLRFKSNKTTNFCELHPYVSNVASIFDHTGTQQKKYFCYKEHTTSVCRHCSTVRYLPNFEVNKFCFEDSEFLRKLIKENCCISLDQYLIE